MSEDLKTLKKKVNKALSNKDFDSAKEYLNEILAITPDDDVAWNNRGIVLSKLGKPKNAVLSFDKAIELNPKVPQVWYGKGAVLMQLKKYRYALGCFYKVLDIDPTNKKAEAKFVEALALLRGEEPPAPAKKEGKNPWTSWYSRLSFFCEEKFGPDWDKDEKEFWEKMIYP
jgi:tetratricopeptide (TPR) repeat protein